MLTPNEYDRLTDQLMPLYWDLDEAIVSDIARRLMKTGGDYLPSSAAMQAKRMQQSGLLYEDIISDIAQRAGMTERQVAKTFERAGVQSIRNDNRSYQAAGLEGIVKLSDAALQTLGAGYRKCAGNLQNLTLTTANTAQTAYIHACNLAYMEVSTGTLDYQTAIRRAVQSAADEGATVLYPSGHKDKLDVAVRRSVITGVGQTVRTLSEINANDMGCDLMEITAHAGARPSHAEWQGQIVSLSGRRGYLSKNDIGYGTGDGFGGWNCRHDWYPFFEGISQRAYTDERLQELNAAHIDLGDDRLYTDYEVSQMQRSLERDVRACKRSTAAFQAAAEEAEDEATQSTMRAAHADAAVKLKAAEKELKDFCNKTGFQQDSSRVWVNGFGHSQAQKAVWANKKSLTKSSGSGTIGRKNQKILWGKISSGEISLTINTDVQNRHFLGTAEYEKFSDRNIQKSYFLSDVTLKDLQEFLLSNAGKGSITVQRDGTITETFDFGKDVAFDTRLQNNTRYLKAKYSKTRTHFSPYSPMEGEDIHD